LNEPIAKLPEMSFPSHAGVQFRPLTRPSPPEGARDRFDEWIPALSVIPAQAGIQSFKVFWTHACAGVTVL
jgi:hypothetical protein